MKRVLINSFFVSLVFFQFNCAPDSAANDSNSRNANVSATASPTAESVVAKVAETPLPDFTNADEAFVEGSKLFDTGENEKAIEAFRQAVKINPDLAEAHFKLGIAYALVENTEPQTDAAEEKPVSTKKAKKDATQIVTKSDKAFDSAVKAYKKIVAKNPKDDAAHFNLGRSYNKLNQDREAQKSLNQAVKLKPDDALYQTELGAILIKLAQYEEAVNVLKRALKLDENNSLAEDLLEKAQAGSKRVGFAKKQNAEREERAKPR